MWNGKPYYKERRQIVDTYICWALGCTYKRGVGLARYVILDRLGDYTSVGEWLSDKGFVTDDTPLAEIQAYRLRWVNALIDEFSVA